MEKARIIVIGALISLIATTFAGARMTPRFPEPPEHSTFLFSSDISVNYEKHGSADATLVLLHGFGASLETWRDVLPYLEPSFTLYLVDLKGFGLSSKPGDGKYAPTDQAEIVAAFLDYVRVNHAVLVGNSYGGAIALMTYFRLPESDRRERIRALVLIDAAAYDQDLPFFIEILRMPVLNRILPNMMSADRRARMVLKQAFYDDAKVTPERIRRHSQFLKLPGSLRALRSTAQQLIPKDLPSFVDRIKQVDVPTLIVWGENDEVIPKAFGQRFHREIPASTLRILSECGHLPQEEKPDDTAAAIKDFAKWR